MRVRAPFAGVITLRNVDVGALVTEASTLLFRIAQTDRLRTYVNVPQSDADSVHVGQAARLSIPDLAGTPVHWHRHAHRQCARSQPRALCSPKYRWPNSDGAADARHVRAGGSDHAAQESAAADPRRYAGGAQRRTAGRPWSAPIRSSTSSRSSWAATLAIRSKFSPDCEAGQQVVVNPGDTVQEGVKVNPVPLREKKRPA